MMISIRQSLQRAFRILDADERGEGVISTGIAVLVMAALGAAMFVIFRTTMEGADEQVNTELDKITTPAGMAEFSTAG